MNTPITELKPIEATYKGFMPIWKPQSQTLRNIDKGSFKAFRSSCDAFIKKNEVRVYLLSKFENKCIKCHSGKSLEIDHIKSVYHCFNNKLVMFCNSEINLQIMCKKCNASKKPD